MVVRDKDDGCGANRLPNALIGFIFSITVNVPQVIELTSSTTMVVLFFYFLRNNIFKSDKELCDKGPAMGVRMTQVTKELSARLAYCPP
jgi:hypothetical protein